jgi:hypothetical protein
MTYRSLLLPMVAFCALGAAAQSVTLQRVPGAAHPYRFTVSPSAQQTVVQASTDLRNWVSIRTNAASASATTVTDSQSASFPRRFYRVQSLPAALSDLSQQPNSVFMGGEGFNTLQYAPNGKLGFIVWRGQDLVYRERINGLWYEQIVGRFGNAYVAGPREEYRFQPFAALLFDSQSRARVLWLSGSTVRHHIQQASGAFTEAAAISLGSVGTSFCLFNAAIGPGDFLHISVVANQSNGAISYGSNRNGSWQWARVTNVVGDPRGFFKQSFAPRWFSMAIDSQNNAHLTFCPHFQMPLGPEGYVKPNNELHYASNRGGAWFTQRIAWVPDLSGEAGEGASIAIGPNDQPAIAAWYNERVSTGSSDHCQLFYYARDGAGNWSKQLVAANAAGYIAGDGDNGTGFAPYLRFDSRGRPNIAFCDDAAQHHSPYQNEYAGNLRHAWFDAGRWNTRPVYTQTAPLAAQIVYPAVATFGNEMVFTGLDRRTTWQTDRVATSTYYFFFVPMALP